jgi:hypothetical protein
MDMSRLNIVFLILAAALIVRFARTGGGMMLKMMGGAPEQPSAEAGNADHGMHGTAGGHGTGDGHGAHQAPAAPHLGGLRQSGRAGDQGHAHPGHES